MKFKFFLLPFLVGIMLISACSSAGTSPNTQSSPASPSVSEIVPLPTKTLAPPTPEPTKFDPVTLDMNYSKISSYAPVYIAEKLGYFEEFGITLNHVTFNRSTDALPLLISGDLDVYLAVVNSGLINSLEQDPSIKVVADRGSMKTGDCTYLGILVRKDLFDSGQIKSAKDLKGKIVAANPGNSTGYLLSKYLEQADLTLDDVTIKDIPTAGFIDSFNTKSVDVIVVPELWITRIMKGGNAVVLAGAQDVIGKYQLSVMVFGKSLIVDHPDLAARFLAAYLKGVEQYQQGKTEANVQIVADATGEDVASLQDSCWPSIRSDGAVDFAGVEPFQQWAIKMKYLDTPISEAQFWDPSFLAAAEKLLGH